MLAAPGLRVALATTHLPLSEVSRAITREHLTGVLRILHADLRTSSVFPIRRFWCAVLIRMPAKAGTWAAKRSK